MSPNRLYKSASRSLELVKNKKRKNIMASTLEVTYAELEWEQVYSRGLSMKETIGWFLYEWHSTKIFLNTIFCISIQKNQGYEPLSAANGVEFTGIWHIKISFCLLLEIKKSIWYFKNVLWIQISDSLYHRKMVDLREGEQIVYH